MPTSRFDRTFRLIVVLLGCLLMNGGVAVGQTSGPRSAASPVLYGASAGTAMAEVRGPVLSLANQMMEAQWTVRAGKLNGVKFVVRGTGAKIALPRDPFLLILKDGTSIRASEMTLTEVPRVQALHRNPEASRAAEHFSGQALLVRLQDKAKTISVTWRAILLDGSNYVRQEITISALNDDRPIAEVRLFDGSLPGASVVGTVKGSPVTAGDLFLGFEDPLAQCQAGEIVTCGMKRELPLRKGQTVDYSLVIGVSPAGTDAARVSELRGAGARASLPDISALQHLV